MMQQALLAEFDHEAATTAKVLANIPADQFSWRPHEKSFTMGGLANHIVDLYTWAVATIDGDKFDMKLDGANFATSKATTVEELLANLEANRVKARASIEALKVETLGNPWSLANGGHVIFTQPKGAVLRGMVFNHLVHHRGQLSVYLRLTGAPVPSIYGPSADDKGGM
ncbi:hypothetical protein F183_A06820 [Bryobacterales bacterium F-183]|nr:hypothetical protein F183_A06820 [Bryobacterales bacterium F-183]